MEKESCLNCKSFEKYDDLDLDDEIFGVCKQDGCHDCCESTKCEQYSPIKPKLMTFNEARVKLREIIPDEFYINTSIDILDHPGGKFNIGCKVSSGNTSMVYSGKTFEEAIMKIKGDLLEEPTREESEQITSDIQPEEL